MSLVSGVPWHRLTFEAQVIPVPRLREESSVAWVDFLAEGVCEPCEAPHLHTHGEVLALDKAGRNVRGVTIARDSPPFASNTLCRAISGFLLACPINLHQHGVINLAAESALSTASR